MERIHQLTKEFMDTAGQVVRETPSVPTVDEMKLRLSLEFEELKEKAQAMGLEGSFAILVSSFVDTLATHIRDNNSNVPSIYTKEDLHKRLKLADTNEVNLLEVFDAALDQRVVASGTDLAFGFQHIIGAGDREVHRSNMSKFDDTVDDCSKTNSKYLLEGIGVDNIQVNGRWVTRRAVDNKILKSHKYSPANLEEVFEVANYKVDSNN